MAADEPVVLTRVSGEIEAEMICGLLRSNGIQCGHRETAAIDSPLEDFTGSGPREILVHADDLETARELLPGDAAG
jgi:putative signal transducing protein